jgi:hypothetical protein
MHHFKKTSVFITNGLMLKKDGIIPCISWRIGLENGWLFKTGALFPGKEEGKRRCPVLL